MRKKEFLLLIIPLMILSLSLSCDSDDKSPRPLANTGLHEQESPVPAQEPVLITIGNHTDVTGIAAFAMEIITSALEDTVEYYNEHWRDIDLVILDIVMPFMDGGEAFIEMKKVNPDIRAILSSGYTIDGEAQRILNKGAKAFIKKPFGKAELLEKIKEVLK